MNKDFSENVCMREALAQARRAFLLGEVPVGAVVLYENQIISRAHNEVELRCDPCAHAEILAIQRASSELGTWRLNGASLFVTLEPCTMCIGAAVLARISNLFFGCSDPRQGAVGSLYDLSSHCSLPHTINVVSEVLEAECRELLTNFFATKRKSVETLK